MAVSMVFTSMAVTVILVSVAVTVVTALLLFLVLSIIKVSLRFVDILIALESMRVGLIFEPLNLDGSVVQVELSPADVGDSGKSLEGGVGADVAREGQLLSSEFPHVEIVHLGDVLGVGCHDGLVELFDVDFVRGSLHHNSEALLEDGKCSYGHDDREDVGADGISVPECGPDVDNDGGNNDTDRHDKISENVESSTVDVHVAGAFRIAVGVTMAVAMTV